jgi:hypothetical protein
MILATDAYAERRPMQETEEAIDRTMNKGLKYNVRGEPKDVLYVTAEEILEGLYEPGELYWKKEGGPMRVHNSSHLQGHVMREYLAERTKILVSKYPWDMSEMGFLAFTWSKTKRLRYSKRKPSSTSSTRRRMGGTSRRETQSLKLSAPSAYTMMKLRRTYSCAAATQP